VAAADRGALQSIESVEGSGFIGETAEGEGVERWGVFGGVDEALAGDLLVHDAGSEGDDAHVVPVSVECGLD
jgi:hypothetical protein